MIISVLKPFKRVFIAVAAFTAVMNLLMLVPSFYMLEVYDRVLSSKNEFTLLMLSCIMLILYVVYSALENVRGFATIKLGEEIDSALSEPVYNAAFNQALKNPGTNNVQVLHDLTNLRQFLTSAPLFSFFDAPWFPIYLTVTFFFNFWLGVFSLISVLLLIILTIANESVTKKPLDEANSLSMNSVNMAFNTMRNAEVLQAMGMLPNMRSRWLNMHKQFLENQSLASMRGSSIGSFTRFVRLSTQSLILGVGAYLVIHNEISAGMMIAASILLGRTLAPVEQVIATWKQFKGAIASYDRLVQLLKHEPQQNENMSLPPPKGRLSVENIAIVPPGSTKPVIQGVNFALEPGDVLGIIGASASGKSSLARALVGVWEVVAGCVRLDGSDVHSWNKSELGPFVGYVPQDVEIFQGSISENISRFGKIDSKLVIAAATAAGIHEMILRLPDGYDTILGPGGSGLSGGQMQRLAIARALYGDPVFIVLDEPNSNLDDAGERSLVKSLIDCKNRFATVVVVTHRTSVLQATTKLLVMSEGKMLMSGPTQQVLDALQNSQRMSQASDASSKRSEINTPQ